MVGLKRAGFTLAEIKILKAAYRLLYCEGLKREVALQRIESELPNEHTAALVAFVRSSNAAFVGAVEPRTQKTDRTA